MTTFRLVSIKELSREHPAFSESALRNLVTKAQENGLKSAILKVGGRVLFNQGLFEKWLLEKAG